ncbi:MAG: DNA topoisomerase III [Sporomusaceae bacterium]|nr:DNA topoisomerase III [Sporomusaceae bacterium]
MSKIVVLAEKPSVGRDIARVLQCHKKGNGYLEGDRYIVTWALGHLVTLADPEVYNDQYKSWRLEDLPMLPPQMKLTVIRQSARQFQSVKEQLLRKDVTEVIIATDAGREGELVARWILAKASVHKPLKRLWISSVTDKAIREGFLKLRPGKDYENLYASAVARSEADWLVGINATRALTCKFNAQLSCGRVQTPTLAMIARREAEITAFQPQIYYGIQARTGQISWQWHEKTQKNSRIFDEAKCKNIFTGLRGKTLKVLKIEKKEKQMPAPQLYDLTELQRDANRLFDFSAKETLSLMQSLYESHKLLTYPRTDSRYLSADIVETLPERMKAAGVGPYTKFAFQLLKQPLKIHKNVVDDSKVSDHHAIIPTEQYVNLSNLSDKERKIYDLVVKRFFAVFYRPYRYEQTTLNGQIGQEAFSAKGKRVTDLGWKEIYGSSLVHEQMEESDDERSDQELPSVTEGASFSVDHLAVTTGKTKPPARFTEAALLSAMENPVRFMEGEAEALKQTIGATGGLGTVATRADIIEKLFNSFLLEQKGKEILLTEKGRQLLSLVPEKLRSPALTAEWELRLAAIAKGALSERQFVAEMRQYAMEVVTEIKNSQSRFHHDNMTRTKCPECGKYLLEVKGKKGKMLVCQDRECGYRKGLAKVTNARCPTCHKKLELRGEGEGQLFVCSCGYREKLSAFKKRREETGGKVDKKAVHQFLKAQDKQEAPVNTALADALAKLKLSK